MTMPSIGAVEEVHAAPPLPNRTHRALRRRDRPKNEREIVEAIEEEIDFIIQRTALPGVEGPKWGMEHLQWYLRLSRVWTLPIIKKLSNEPPGNLLDVGAGFGLLAGVAWQFGWKVSTVDVTPLPDYSGLVEPARAVVRQVVNANVDPLPFPDGAFSAVVLSEVLEHLPYSPLPLFREIRRVLRPGGKLFLSTPQPASLGKIFLLLRGKNHEPFLEDFIREDDTYDYKGRTFFKSGRETKLWTAGELHKVLPMCGLRVTDTSYYGSVFPDANHPNTWITVKSYIYKLLGPRMHASRFFGGGVFVVATRD